MEPLGKSPIDYQFKIRDFNRRFKTEPDEEELTRLALNNAASMHPGLYEYQKKGIDRLIVAIFARATRDVYDQDRLIRSDARDWMRRHAQEYLLDCGINIPVDQVCDWISSGFMLPEYRKKILFKRGMD
jgi:hypothetical protein